MERSGQPTLRSERRYQRVAAQILQAMASGALPPGSRLPSDRDLAVQLGVSRPTAREGLLALEVIGAVEIKHGSGVFVTDPGQTLQRNRFLSAETLPHELIEARLALEPSAVAIAATQLPPAAIGNLRRDIEEARSVSEDPKDLQRFVTISFNFHRTLVSQCGNRIVASVVTDLVDTGLHPLWNLINQNASRTATAREKQLREHSHILDALEARDAEAARVAMEDHIRAIANSMQS